MLNIKQYFFVNLDPRKVDRSSILVTMNSQSQSPVVKLFEVFEIDREVIPSFRVQQ